MTADKTTAERSGNSGRPARSAKPAGVFGREYLWISIGMCALVTLAAFESMAVTTIMPMISVELNGASVYALAFAGPLAVGVVGMVLAGNWSDRSGPRGALYASAVSFVVGLAIVGTASDMAIFIVGRLVQGLGAGGLTVALYVIIARVYPPVLHPPIFAAFAAAWVVPSMVGPLIAGLVADYVGWRWVFLGVIALVFVAAAMVIPALKSLVQEPSTTPPVPWNLGRICWAVLAAAAVLGLNLSADAAGLIFWIGPIVAIVVAVIALRPLLPRGTLRLRAGLPAVIVMRGLLAGSFFGAEVYIPYMLTKEYGFVAAGAGLALTASGVTWAAGSWVQSRYATQLPHVRSFRIGASMLSVAVLLAALTAALSLPPALAIAGWAIGGAGMGLMYPRTSVLTLEYSTVENQGFNSSALSIADSIGASIALAATAIVFAILLPLGGAWPFAGCFALTTVLALVALAASPRVAQRN
ncbi:MFS transporter [Rathayibacter soli]|uniref:MFS transporter n=1 Tax=Rathayibacter soli TaxID=3144168 RepID=UPI0027E57C94|nr:MFS transporter [Glaciibacter superstes]